MPFDSKGKYYMEPSIFIVPPHIYERLMNDPKECVRLFGTKNIFPASRKPNKRNHRRKKK